MISLKTLAEYLETQLNNELNRQEDGKYIYSSLHNIYTDYQFKIYADTANPVFSERDGNKVTKYIVCNLQQISGDIQSKFDIDLTYGTRMEILIPLINGSVDDGIPDIVTDVRTILDTMMSQLQVSEITDNGELFSLGIDYTPPASGTRDTRADIGDSYTFIAYTNFYIIAEGINSADVGLFYKYTDGTTEKQDRIVYTTLGLNRSSVQDGIVLSKIGTENNDNSVTKFKTTANVMNISFSMVLRNDVFSKKIIRCAMTGENAVFSIVLSWGNAYTQTYKMSLKQADLNADTVLNSSCSVSFVEEL